MKFNKIVCFFLLFTLNLSNAYIYNNSKFINYLKLLDQQLDKSKYSLGDLLHSIFSYSEDPHSNLQAQVRIQQDLCFEEKQFLEVREVITHQAIEKLVGINLSKNEIPRIALCFSGGGYRAMISTLGFLISAQKMGILDAVSYIACLSGSTWAICSWMAHELSLLDLKTLIREQIKNPIDTGFNISHLIENGISKLIYGQKLNLVGIWGSLLANILFSDFDKKFIEELKRLSKAQIPTLSQSRLRLSNGAFPMPIYTAALVAREYDWIEFTPYEIGSIGTKSFVPSWSFGRKFKGGISIDYPPECGLDYYMGIWGSAFTASASEILEIYSSSLPSVLYQTLDCIVGTLEYGLGEFRLSPALIRNFAYMLDGHPFKYEKFLTLVDAGLDFNLPIPPLLRKERKVDIIIICDASSDIENAPELRLAEQYAVKNNIKFPIIDYQNIDKNIVSVFKDEQDPEKPVIIYMPRIKNENYSKTFDPTKLIKEGGYCSSFNLQYSIEQFNELCGLIEYNAWVSKDVIIKTIKDVIKAKSVDR